jgi:hypothetical protein
LVNFTINSSLSSGGVGVGFSSGQFPKGVKVNLLLSTSKKNSPSPTLSFTSETSFFRKESRKLGIGLGELKGVSEGL